MEGDVKRSIDPCDDFYEYSCGSYIDKYLPYRNTLSNVFRDKFISLGQENVIKAKEAIENMKDTKDPFFKKAFQFYQTCMSGIRTMAPYFKAVDDIGGSSITTIGKFDYYTWNLETALLKLKLNYNTNPLFKIHIGHDLFKTSRNIILVSKIEINKNRDIIKFRKSCTFFRIKMEWQSSIRDHFQSKHDDILLVCILTNHLY